MKPTDKQIDHMINLLRCMTRGNFTPVDWVEEAKAILATLDVPPPPAPKKPAGREDDGGYEWAYGASLNILQAALEGLPEAEADLPMPRMARRAAAAIERLRAPSPAPADAPGEPSEVERALDTAAETMERVASALHNGGGTGHEEVRLLEAVKRIRALRRERSKK